MTHPGALTAETPLRIYVDLSAHVPLYRREWEAIFENAPSSEVVLTTGADTAHCTLRTCDFLDLGTVMAANRYLARARQDPPEFVWNGGDFPAGFEAGLYCSLPKSLFNHRRHRTFCYPITFNECVEAFEPSEARYLYSFVGGVSSGLRSRLVSELLTVGRPDEMVVKVQGGPWNAMFDRSGIELKRFFADAVRHSKFVLCPRGNGVSSIRLFETMKAGRVPVIISDDFVLPEGIDWPTCSVRVAERDIAKVPQILRGLESNWMQLASNAHRAWEANYSPERLVSSIGSQLRDLLRTPVSISTTERAKIRLYPLMTKARSLRRRLASHL